MKRFQKFPPIDSFSLQHTISVLLLVLAAATSISCRNDSGPTIASLRVTAGIGQFPMSVGDTWTYVAYDSLANTVDTVSVEIVAPAQKQMFTSLWVFSGKTYNDTSYVLVNGNTLLMYDDPLASQPSVAIEFPLTTGSSWGNAADTNIVRIEPNVVVPAGVWGNVFLVERHAWGLNYRLDSRTWIAAGVGIVGLERKVLNLGPYTWQRWQLLRFRLAQ